MKKLYLYLLLCVILAGCKPSERNKSINLENTLLWEISGNGLPSPSYLFGTNHFIGGNFADSLPVIGEKFKACKAVVGELVIDTEALHKFNPDWLLKNNSLNKIFTPKEFSTIAKVLSQYAKLDLNKFSRLKPECIKLILLQSMAPKTISPTNPSLDEYFQDEGRKRGYKILGLETVEFQNNLVFNQPIEIQKKHLLFTVSNVDLTSRNLKTMFKLYIREDLNGVDELMLTDKEYSQEEEDQLVKDRNLKWLDKLPIIMKQQPTFIAVGMGHMIWDCGLINQLRLKGFTVKPIKI